jgi:hypothetical protein
VLRDDLLTWKQVFLLLKMRPMSAALISGARDGASSDIMQSNPPTEEQGNETEQNVRIEISGTETTRCLH